MNGLYSCIIAISMYSKIPMPRVEWTKERMAYVMCFFPITGLLEGILLALWLYLGLNVFGFSILFTALTAAAVPLLVTGGIHMDGFIDTMDALHSYGDREKKMEILKDPHIGAFAVICLSVYMLLYVGVFYEYALLLAPSDRNVDTAGLLYLMPVVILTMERSFSGLSVLVFPPAKKDGLAAGFANAAKKTVERPALFAWLAVCATMPLFAGMTGLLAGISVLAVQLLVFLWYYRMSWKEFGGVTGDLAGCFLQICELAGFGAVVLLGKIIFTGGIVA